MSRSPSVSHGGPTLPARATGTRTEWPWGEIIVNALTDPFVALVVLLICLVASAVESLQ
jgi:hypothetical protein